MRSLTLLKLWKCLILSTGCKDIGKWWRCLWPRAAFWSDGIKTLCLLSWPQTHNKTSWIVFCCFLITQTMCKVRSGTCPKEQLSWVKLSSPNLQRGLMWTHQITEWICSVKQAQQVMKGDSLVSSYETSSALVRLIAYTAVFNPCGR